MAQEKSAEEIHDEILKEALAAIARPAASVREVKLKMVRLALEGAKYRRQCVDQAGGKASTRTRMDKKGNITVYMKVMLSRPMTIFSFELNPIQV